MTRPARDLFRMQARHSGGQLRSIRFSMASTDQRSVTSVGCDLLTQQTGVPGWSPLTVEWLNRQR